METTKGPAVRLRANIALVLLLFLAAAVCRKPACAQTAGSRYALLVGGLGGTPEYTSQFATYLNDTRAILVDRYGFAPDDVVVLAEQTIADRPFVNGVASADEIRAHISRLDSRITRDDHLYVILFGHGSFDGTNASLNIPRRDLEDAEYARLLEEIDAGRLIFINTASASGPFAAALSGRDRIIITATASGTERDETVFPRHFVEALRSVDADLDKNGALSVREAFVYAARQTTQSFENSGRLATEHAQLDDDGDGGPSRLEDVENGREGNLAAVTYFLPPRAGTSISEDALPLVREKEGIEREIAELKGRKERLSEEAYYAELETLFVRLARLNEQLDGTE